MSRKLIIQLAGCLLIAGVVCLPARGDDDDTKPKATIKEVMKKVFHKKTGVLKKVASGEASDAEKKSMHEMLVALSKNKPPKGEQESWGKLTGALVKASEKVVKGDAEGVKMLKKAANCGACHKAHKP